MCIVYVRSFIQQHHLSLREVTDCAKKFIWGHGLCITFELQPVTTLQFRNSARFGETRIVFGHHYSQVLLGQMRTPGRVPAVDQIMFLRGRPASSAMRGNRPRYVGPIGKWEIFTPLWRLNPATCFLETEWMLPVWFTDEWVSSWLASNIAISASTSNRAELLTRMRPQALPDHHRKWGPRMRPQAPPDHHREPLTYRSTKKCCRFENFIVEAVQVKRARSRKL